MKPEVILVLSVVGVILLYLIIQNLRLGNFKLWFIQTITVIAVVVSVALVHNVIECGNDPPPFCGVDLTVYYFIAMVTILIIQQVIFLIRNKPK